MFSTINLKLPFLVEGGEKHHERENFGELVATQLVFAFMHLLNSKDIPS